MTKTFDKKDIFCLVNAENAKPYIGKVGYVADNMRTLKQNIEENWLCELIGIEDDYILPFKICTKKGEIVKFGLFLPVEKVREEKKKYRPFKNLEEFKTELNDIEYGDVVRFREKTDHAIEHYGGYLGHSEKDKQLLAIALGAFSYSPKQLFNYYELFNKGEWQPFGVLEE